jgi:hypothetical protein
MKRSISVDDNKEKDRERKKAHYSHHNSLFVVIPIEIINLIVAR